MYLSRRKYCEAKHNCFLINFNTANAISCCFGINFAIFSASGVLNDGSSSVLTGASLGVVRVIFK